MLVRIPTPLNAPARDITPSSVPKQFIVHQNFGTTQPIYIITVNAFICHFRVTSSYAMVVAIYIASCSNISLSFV